jgi:hypothetical protein
MMFSCYRKDEAHDPAVYVAAAAAVLGCYPTKVIDRVTDPRTGLPSDLKFLPSVAEIREACDRAAILIDKMSEPKRRPVAFVPPPKLPGQIDCNEFAALVAAGKTPKAVISRFEARSPEREAQSEADKAEMAALIQHANQVFWDRSTSGETQ